MMTTRRTVPFLNWKSEVRDAVILADAYPSAEWFDRTQGARLVMMHEIGETIQSAAEMIATFGRAVKARPSKSPLSLAREWKARGLT
jgi:hypothetical protein